MYIQEVIIDGFKSYAQKTIVSGFDPQFNAITGLNGTGKSNILDAICFVLGISNLSQVRVGNLQELVYKQGAAGVMKATVTIIFNNQDVAGSPVGYELSKEITVTRQIVIGGKNKYMINGHVVQQSQLQNMFHSVQLNVNNPHFLIMQGRITKVLNMKPIETLSMIEEAAGTRMYESKKQAATKTIEKKQLKVDEITKCILEEITPTLENLRTERLDYHEWTKNSAECERLERIVIAYEFRQAEESVTAAEGDKQRLVDEEAAFMQTQEDKTADAKECETKITEIENTRDNELGSELTELKAAEVELSKDLVKQTALFNNQKESITSEKDALASLTKQMASNTKQRDSKTKELEVVSGKLALKVAECEAGEANYNSLREKFQNAQEGVADESSSELLSLPEQVAVWEKKEREAQSQIKQCQQKAEHQSNQLKELKKSNKAQAAAHSVVIKESETLRAAILAAEGKLSQLSFNEQQETDIKYRVSELKNQKGYLRDAVDTTGSFCASRLRFDYSDPEKNFDRSRVKGVVASLLRVSDRNAATALEIAAGGKLTQVVVDSADTGKLLINKGNLRNRAVFIPLNKINAYVVPQDKVNRAKQIAASLGGTAFLALELITFEPYLRKAMEYCFGAAFVCSSAEIAKTIAFDKGIRQRSVSLEGDSYDPSGTLTGGSKNNLGVLLGKIGELHEAKEQLAKVETELRQLEQQLVSMDREVEESVRLTSELEVKRHALKLTDDKIAESSYAESMGQINEIEAALAGYDEEVKNMKAQGVKATEELKKLKATVSDIKKQRETAMKGMEAAVRAAQKTVSGLKAEVMALRNTRDALEKEVSHCTLELSTLNEQFTIAESANSRLATESENLSKRLALTKSDFEAAQKAVKDKNAELAKCSKEIKILSAEREKLLKDAQNASLEARKIQHKLKQWEKDFKEAGRVISQLIKVNPWIEREKQHFGLAGSDFDFGTRDMGEAAKRLKTLKVDQERLSKKINKKVMGMIESAESEYKELNRKKEVILADKAKIEDVILELDNKKKEALNTTWVKVNRDFGSIFSMLLPGTTAKLDPHEDGVMGGLEVKVAFNGVWKESLTELSGGQRSLLALSLILALLLFKPAPMYILDEVDAALDLSHTQNIGMMLRTHFSTSQFIVVSLKEGMFNNANVIFRTRFVDGISAVQRTVVGGRAKAIAASSSAVTADDEEAEPPTKKKGKAKK